MRGLGTMAKRSDDSQRKDTLFVHYITLRNEHLADEVEGIHKMLFKWNQRGDR